MLNLQNSISIKTAEPKSLIWGELLALATAPTLLNYLACRAAIPFLVGQQMPIEIAYFLSVGGLMLAPMFAAAIYLTMKSGRIGSMKELLSSMFVKKLNRADWAWAIGGFIGLSMLSFAVAKTIVPLLGWSTKPFFFQNMPLEPENYWVLCVWLPYFSFNILGEELYWRGYVMPRQIALTGNWTWFAQGCSWAIWHLPLGVEVVVTSLPLLFILPAIVQYRRNTAISIIVHAIFGAFGFFAVASGMVH